MSWRQRNQNTSITAMSICSSSLTIIYSESPTLRLSSFNRVPELVWHESSVKWWHDINSVLFGIFLANGSDWIENRTRPRADSWCSQTLQQWIDGLAIEVLSLRVHLVRCLEMKIERSICLNGAELIQQGSTRLTVQLIVSWRDVIKLFCPVHSALLFILHSNNRSHSRIADEVLLPELETRSNFTVSRDESICLEETENLRNAH